MEKWNYLNSSVLISFKLEECGAREELSALGGEHAGHVHELIVVDALGAVLGQRDVLFQQVPKLLQVLLVKHLGCFVLEKTSARFLPHAEVQRILVVWFLVEELWYVFKCRILLLFKLFFFF